MKVYRKVIAASCRLLKKKVALELALIAVLWIEE